MPRFRNVSLDKERSGWPGEVIVVFNRQIDGSNQLCFLVPMAIDHQNYHQESLSLSLWDWNFDLTSTNIKPCFFDNISHFLTITFVLFLVSTRVHDPSSWRVPYKWTYPCICLARQAGTWNTVRSCGDCCGHSAGQRVSSNVSCEAFKRNALKADLSLSFSITVIESTKWARFCIYLSSFLWLVLFNFNLQKVPGGVVTFKNNFLSPRD